MSEQGRIIPSDALQKKRDAKKGNSSPKKSQQAVQPINITAHKSEPVLHGADISIESDQQEALKKVSWFALLNVNPLDERTLQEKNISIDDIYADGGNDDDSEDISPTIAAMRQLEKDGTLQNVRDGIGNAVFHMIPFVDDLFVGGYLNDVADRMSKPEKWDPKPSGAGTSPMNEDHYQLSQTFTLSDSALKKTIQSLPIASDKRGEVFTSIRTDQRNILYAAIGMVEATFNN